MEKYFLELLPISLVIISLLFCKIHIKDFTPNPLSIDKTTSYKGIFAIVVILHHLSQRITNEFYFMKLFIWMGPLAVCIFFFISGYGLMKSNLNKDNYKNQFLTLRLSKILIPYIIVNFIYWLYYALINNNVISFPQIFINIWNGGPIVSNSWYIIAIIFAYISFYISMLIFDKKKLGIILTSFIFCVLWCLFCYFKGYGSWWYKTIFTYLVGIIFASYELNITDFIKKYFWILLFGNGFLFLFFMFVFVTGKIFVNIELLKLLGKILAYILFSTLFTIVILKLEVGNFVTKFLGKISFEIYMIHGLFIMLFRSSIVYIESDMLWSICVIGCAIIVALLLNLIFKQILKILLKPFYKKSKA